MQHRDRDLLVVGGRGKQAADHIGRRVVAARNLLLLAQHALAALHVVIEGLQRSRRRGILETNDRRIELEGAGQLERVRLVAERNGMGGAIRLAIDHQAFEPIVAFQGDEVAGECGERQYLPALFGGNEVAPVGPAGRRQWRGDDLEVLGAVRISPDDEHVAPVIDMIFQFRFPGDDQTWWVLRSRGVEQPGFRRVGRAGREHDESPCARPIDLDGESVILFFEDELIAGWIAADPMAVRESPAIFVIEAHVDQRRVVQPGEIGNVRNDVRQVASGPDVQDTQREGFRSGLIDQIAIEPVIRTMSVSSEREICLSGRECCSVEQDLLGTSVARSPHELRLLGAGHISAPIGVGAVEHRNPGIELLDPALHLFDEFGSQACERCEHGVGIVVFGVEMGAESPARAGMGLGSPRASWGRAASHSRRRVQFRALSAGPVGAPPPAVRLASRSTLRPPVVDRRAGSME